MAAMEGNGDCELDEEDAWFIKATVGCKWGMTAQRLFIPLIVLFHLPEILGGHARATRPMLCGFHFLLVPMLVNALPQLQCRRAHADASSQTLVHSLINTTIA
jgi:hypothetical protein